MRIRQGIELPSRCKGRFLIFAGENLLYRVDGD